MRNAILLLSGSMPGPERQAPVMRRISHPESTPMTIDAVVFDAYGTLYDIQSVATATRKAYPHHAELITQVWRLKQLEYTWLRSAMPAYRSFRQVSEESLAYTLAAIGLPPDDDRLAFIMDKYLHLDPYPETLGALDALHGLPRAILSNGNPDMLEPLVENTGLRPHLEAIISVDAVGVFKPDPRAYDLVRATLRVEPAQVLFVSSNSFDACAAKHYGFQVAWIERVPAAALHAEVASEPSPGPLTVFKLLRMRQERLGVEVDHRLSSLNELAQVLANANGSV